ncbi:transcriptional regulator [Bacteroidota bacterium]
MSNYICKKEIMLPDIEKIKGVHPGAVLARELKKRGIGSSVFAREIGEYASVITDITKLRRGITPQMSIKLGNTLGANEDYFLLLQAYYQVRKVMKKQILDTQETPDLNIISRQIFWEIDFDSLDYTRYKDYVIKRVFERGNESEIREIIRFYGDEECRRVIGEADSLFYLAAENARLYLNMKNSEIKCLRNLNGKQYQSPWLRS